AEEHGARRVDVDRRGDDRDERCAEHQANSATCDIDDALGDPHAAQHGAHSNMPCVQRRAPRPRPSPFSYVFVERGAGALSQTPPGWLCSGQMAPPIRLSVPGTLLYRPIAVRTVAEAARLVSGSAQRDAKNSTIDLGHDVRHPFDTAVVSAFMEIFNNVAIHAYQRKGGGTIEIEVALSKDAIVIEVRD